MRNTSAWERIVKSLQIVSFLAATLTVSGRTFLTISVVHLHVYHSAGLIAQHHRVTSIPFGYRPQLSQILIGPPQPATWKNRWIIHFPKSQNQQAWLPMEAHAIIICLSLLYHMHIIRWCTVLFLVPKRCYATVYGWASEVVGERERARKVKR